MNPNSNIQSVQNTMQWSNEAKQRLADQIIAQYFQHNFGTMAKTDLETLLFSEYMEARKGQTLSTDDYDLSKELGITQARIRALKIRKELKYPTSVDFEQLIFTAIKSAYWDERGKILCYIEDVNVLIEVRHFLETRNYFDEYSLNQKVMTLQPEAFFLLCSEHDNILDLITKVKVFSLKYKSSPVKEFFANPNVCNLIQIAIKEAPEVISWVAKQISPENAKTATWIAKACNLFQGGKKEVKLK